MKTVSPALAGHLAQETTTLATCWRLARADATVLGFTDHDRDLVIDDSALGLPANPVTYEAAAGYTPTTLESAADLAVDSLDVVGLLDSNGITEADLAAGLYDHAEVRIFLVNHQALGQGVLKLRRGWLGEVVRKRGQFIAELRSLAQRLQQTIGEVYSAACRADLGDARCGVNLAGFTVTGTVTGVTDRRQFADTGRTEADGWLAHGLLTWTGGNNQGLAMEVKAYFLSGGGFVLVQPMPYTIQIGDTYSVYAGCDKRFATCQGKFANAINFRGEPHVPGPDALLRHA